MEAQESLKNCQKKWHGSAKTYAVGFSFSLILTCLSFSLVVFDLLQNRTLVVSLIALALIQALVQLIFFLHIGQEAKPKWETIAFCFTFAVILVIVLGTLWIMNDLNDRMMPPMTSSQ